MEIVIKTQAIEKGQIEESKTLIKNLFDKLSEGLITTSLKKVIIPEDFGEEVLSLQKEYGERDVGYTKNELFEAVAKVLHYRKDGNIFHTIVLDKYVIYMLSTPENQQWGVHTIRHELCHVHDEYIKEDLYNLDIVQDDLLGYVLCVHSDILWSEYSADRLSVDKLDASLLQTFYIPTLFEYIDKTDEMAKQKISEYRLHRDTYKLFCDIQEISSCLLKHAAHILGSLHGYNVDGVIEMLNDGLTHTGFKDIWLELGEELGKLFEIYPNWNGTAQLESLSSVVIKHWNNLGIYPRPTEDKRIYLHVPRNKSI